MKPPALTDSRGMGGVIAQDGFDYQLWDGLVRLPAWLINPAFEGIIFEGLEDMEARFFVPSVPGEHLLERFQAKAGALTPADIRDIFQTFSTFNSHFPDITRVQTLVTPKLPSTVSWLARDPERVRRARPFYSPFANVIAASDNILLNRLIETYDASLGAFIFQSVEVSERNLPDNAAARATFGVFFERAFPSLDVSSRRLQEVFESLCTLARQSVGALIERDTLIQIIENTLGQTLPIPESFPLHIRSDCNVNSEQYFEVDASDFSGNENGFPVHQQWFDNLIMPLTKTARWLRSRNIDRVMLSGSYRLTTAIILGWSLRSAIGFELEIPTKTGYWLTDERSIGDEIEQAWQISEPSKLVNDQLVVSIGILRDPAVGLNHTAGITDEDAVLRLFLDTPILSAKSAQMAISRIKRTIDNTVICMQPMRIQLYFAGPAALAVALGHRWNAMPLTQLHEFVASERKYVATALI